MRSQACEQCAKRKVRCDKQEPCSNCKRRKTSRCSYAEISPLERIKKLEALVRSLGSDPSIAEQGGVASVERSPLPEPQFQPLAQNGNPEATQAPNLRSQDPVVLEEDGQQFYLESNSWQNWMGRDNAHATSRDASTKPSLQVPKHPDVFQRLMGHVNSVDLIQGYPSQETTSILWDMFFRRVEPLVKTSFRWTLEGLQSASSDAEIRQRFTNAEHAFMFALYMISVYSLSDDECKKLLDQERSSLITEYQTLCEEALCRNNIFCMSETLIIKALILYMMASIDRLSTRSLWSLMGLVIRSAERLGIHRDGALLGLSPAATEERRRLWWQLQHVDLALAVRSGSTPMTLTADWDAKMPLNIEDEDISPNMSSPPIERPGLTSMSYCMFTYWVISHQRRCFHNDKSRFELSWQSNMSLSSSFKDNLVDQIEEGLNKKFLQFCDPIKPLDNLLQLSARFLICGMRLRILHPMTGSMGPGRVTEQHREALLSAAVNCLQYNVALHSQRSIRHFNWLTKGFFPWHAFMFVLIELAQQSDQSKIEQIWDLLSDLYFTNSHLSQLSQDRRCHHAAELIVAAWKAQQSRPNSTRRILEPDFVKSLRSQLEKQRAMLMTDRSAQQPEQENVQAASEFVLADENPTEQDFESLFNLDFENIDWSFWSSID